MDVNRGRAGAVRAWCAHAYRIRDYTLWFPMSLSWDIFPWGGTLLPTFPQYWDCSLGEKYGESPAGRGMLLCSSKGSFHNCSSQALKLGCMLLAYRQRWWWRSTCLDLCEGLLVHQLLRHLELSLKLFFSEVVWLPENRSFSKSTFPNLLIPGNGSKTWTL